MLCLTFPSFFFLFFLPLAEMLRCVRYDAFQPCLHTVPTETAAERYDSACKIHLNLVL